MMKMRLTNVVHVDVCMEHLINDILHAVKNEEVEANSEAILHKAKQYIGRVLTGLAQACTGYICEGCASRHHLSCLKQLDEGNLGEEEAGNHNDECEEPASIIRVLRHV